MVATWAAVIISVGLGAAPSLLQPSEILKRITDSKTRYVIEEVDKAGSPVASWADLLWPRAAVSYSFPRPGEHGLVETKVSPETLRVAREAEPLFQAERYEEAATLYRKGLEREPRSFLLLSHLGDCDFKRGDFAAALDRYQRAAEIQPWDHRLWWYRGQALVHLGRRDEALDMFAQALVRKANDPVVVAWLERNADALGIRMDKGPLLAPQALARVEGDAVHLYADPTPHWVAFGLCKALWLGEPSHRKEVLGSEEKVFSSDEERECLASLLGTYASLRNEGKVARDPSLERLREVVEAELTDGFILYELGGRVFPWGALLAGEDGQDQMRRYLRRFVLVDRR